VVCWKKKKGRGSSTRWQDSLTLGINGHLRRHQHSYVASRHMIASHVQEIYYVIAGISWETTQAVAIVLNKWLGVRDFRDVGLPVVFCLKLALRFIGFQLRILVNDAR
jgi:hypothetical protein